MARDLVRVVLQKETNDQRDHRKPVSASVRNGALRERGGKSQVHRCARCGALIIVRIANRAHQKRARKLSSAQTIPAACRDRTPPSISNRLAFFFVFVFRKATYPRALLFCSCAVYSFGPVLTSSQKEGENLQSRSYGALCVRAREPRVHSLPHHQYG